jgi:hypothetical protein
MLGCGESPKEAIRPDFNRSIIIDFQGATISSDTFPPQFILSRICVKDWLRNDDRLRDFSRLKRLKKHFATAAVEAAA